MIRRMYIIDMECGEARAAYVMRNGACDFFSIVQVLSGEVDIVIIEAW